MATGLVAQDGMPRRIPNETDMVVITVFLYRIVRVAVPRINWRRS